MEKKSADLIEWEAHKSSMRSYKFSKHKRTIFHSFPVSICLPNEMPTHWIIVPSSSKCENRMKWQNHFKAEANIAAPLSYSQSGPHLFGLDKLKQNQDSFHLNVILPSPNDTSCHFHFIIVIKTERNLHYTVAGGRGMMREKLMNETNRLWNIKKKRKNKLFIETGLQDLRWWKQWVCSNNANTKDNLTTCVSKS